MLALPVLPWWAVLVGLHRLTSRWHQAGPSRAGQVVLVRRIRTPMPVLAVDRLQAR
jgi:hypothetical protein